MSGAPNTGQNLTFDLDQFSVRRTLLLEITGKSGVGAPGRAGQ